MLVELLVVHLSIGAGLVSGPQPSKGKLFVLVDSLLMGVLLLDELLGGHRWGCRLTNGYCCSYVKRLHIKNET